MIPCVTSVCFVAACDASTLADSPSSQSGPGSVRVPNGTVTYTDRIPGSVATLICNPGYTCGSDGHWSEEVLSCEVMDQPPGTLENSRVCISMCYLFHFFIPASPICGTACIIGIAVSFGVLLAALVILRVTIALCVCRYCKAFRHR